jgi:predicted GNAT family acetyltransferase
LPAFANIPFAAEGHSEVDRDRFMPPRIRQDDAMDEDHHPPEEPDKLDETLEETFPASDAASNTVETGIGLAPAHVADDPVTDNRAAHRFELVTGGEVAFLDYERRGDALVLVHTEVPPAFRGRGMGKALVEAGLEAARREGLRVVPVCPFVGAFLRKHPESGEIGRSGPMLW